MRQNLGFRLRPPWVWAAAIALLCGQWLGTQVAWAHHAQMLAASPMAEVCSAQTDPGPGPGQGTPSPSCCAACVVADAAPPQGGDVGRPAVLPVAIAEAATPAPLRWDRWASQPPARGPPGSA